MMSGVGEEFDDNTVSCNTDNGKAIDYINSYLTDTAYEHALNKQSSV